MLLPTDVRWTPVLQSKLNNLFFFDFVCRFGFFFGIFILFHNKFLLRFCGLSSAAISAVGGFLFYPHNRLYRTRHSVCREDVDTEIQHCYSSSFSFAFLTVSIFYQKRCPIKRTLVMTACGHYREIRRWRVKSDFVRWNRPCGRWNCPVGQLWSGR